MYHNGPFILKNIHTLTEREGMSGKFFQLQNIGQSSMNLYQMELIS